MIYDEGRLEEPLITPDQHTGGHHLRILSLNMFLRPPLIKNNQSDHKNARATYLCDKIIQDFDILCLQEVFSTLNSRRNLIIHSALSKGFNYHAFPPSPGFFRPQIIDGGLLILSRFPILESDFCGFGNGVFPDVFSYKGILYAKIAVNHHILHCFTLHLQASYPTDSEDLVKLYRSVRREQLALCAKFIQSKLTSDSDNCLLAGDFNIDGKSDEYSTLKEMISGFNFVDVLKEKYGQSPSTFGIKLESGEPEEVVLSHRNENTRDIAIDYLFVKGGDFKVSLCETKFQPFYINDMPFTRISDHYGVQTLISFN